MGWYTFGTVKFEFCKEGTFYDKCQLEQNIKNMEEELRYAKDRLKHLAFMTEPKKFFEEDCDTMFRIDEEVNFCIETIQKCSTDLYIYRSVLRDWDKYFDEKDCPKHYDATGEDLMDNYLRIDGDYFKKENEDE